MKKAIHVEENPIKVRAYSEHDKTVVTKLMQDLCIAYNVEFDEERWNASLEKKIMISDSTKLYVADQDGKTIGMLVADIRRAKERAGYITNLIVAPDFRNKGAGELLITSAIDFFKKEHVTTIKVNIRSDTRHVQALFAKLGFEEYAVQLRKIL